MTIYNLAIGGVFLIVVWWLVKLKNKISELERTADYHFKLIDDLFRFLKKKPPYEPDA